MTIKIVKTSLPAPPAGAAIDLRMYLERVREELSRIQEAQESTTTIINNYGTSGTGTGGGGAPDPYNLPCGKTVTPAAPTGLKVSAGFGFFMVEWDMPTYCGHSHTEVYGLKDSDVLNNPPLLGSSPGVMFSLAMTGMNVRYCFWVKHVNLLGEKSAYNATEGLCAVTALDPGYLIELLTGQITETQLYKDLGARIDLIDLPGTGLIDQNTYRQSEEGVLAQRISETSAAVAGVKKITIGATAPTAPNVGDVWYDTSDPTKVVMKSWNGTTWATTRTDIKSFYQTTAPVGTTALPLILGDLWYDTDDNNRPYYWNGTTWIDLASGLINALTEAKIVNFESAKIGYCSKGGVTTADGTRAACEANGGTWLPGLPWATAVKQVSVTYNGQAVSIQQSFDTVATDTGALKAQYSVKIDNQGYVSGFGLSSTPVNGVPFSEFIFRADRFSIAAPSVPGGGENEPSVPFIVTTTGQTIGGEYVPPGVYIKDAYIQNGTITNAKIKNATIDDAKINTLSASKLTAGSIRVDACITSTNFVSGSTGWSICGNGNAEFNNVTYRGTLVGGGATAFDNGSSPGLWAGLVGSTYKFRVGTATGARMYWDGTTLGVVGNITATGGNISGLLTVDNGNASSDKIEIDGPNQRIRIARASGTRVALGRASDGNMGLLIRDENGKVAVASYGTKGLTSETDAWGEPLPGTNEFYIGSAYIKKLRTGSINSGAVTNSVMQYGSWGPSTLTTNGVAVVTKTITLSDLPTGETAGVIAIGTLQLYPQGVTPHVFIGEIRCNGTAIAGAGSAIYTSSTAESMAFTGHVSLGNGTHTFTIATYLQSGSHTTQAAGQIVLMAGKR